MNVDEVASGGAIMESVLSIKGGNLRAKNKKSTEKLVNQNAKKVSFKGSKTKH